MFGVSVKHGSEGLVTSEHGFSIINDTGMTKTYQVHFANMIMFGGTWYSPNAEEEIDMVIETGKTAHYGPIRVTKPAYFGMKGNYEMQAITMIKLDGKVIDSCYSKHIASIF